MPRTLLALSLFLVPSAALAWPADADWDALTQAGVAMTDTAADQASSTYRFENAYDLVGNSGNPVGRWYLDADTLYVGMLVSAAPSALAPPYSGAWGVLIESDGDDDDFEHSISLCSRSDYLCIYANADAGDGPDETAETYVTSLADPLTTDLARTVAAGGTAVGIFTDYYLDFALPLTDLYTAGVLTSTTTFQLCLATSNNTTGNVFDLDTSGHDDTSGLGSLPECLSEPISVDGDADGLTWFEEVDLYGTDPADADTDGDGLDDGAELDTHGTDPLDADSDGDGLTDGEEVLTYGTDPNDTDSDDDGLTDGAEVLTYGTDPLNPDSDGDGLSNSGEVYTTGTDPNVADSDGDGLSDGAEVNLHFTDPLDPDTDDDGLSDGEEIALQDLLGCPDPLDADSDDDGLSDGDELATWNTEPCVPDSDGDGLTDGDEVNTYGTEPDDADTDDDGLSDGAEIALGLSPTTPDTDGDGILDGEEAACQEGGAEATWDDRDADGIPDTTEGTADPDGDGAPAWCDADADGDGKPDAKEGTGDVDCDGIPNFLDPDDADGKCPDTGETGDSDADTDADADTDTDTDADSDADTDTDGDGDTDTSPQDTCDSADIFCKPGKLTGGGWGCSSAGGWDLSLLGLVGLLLLRPRRSAKLRRAVAVLLLSALVLPTAARAQALDAQALHPATDGDRLLVVEDATLSPRRQPLGGLAMLFDYGRDPVTYTLDTGVRDVVSGLGTLDLMGFVRPLPWLRVGGDLPLVPIATGPGITGGHLLGDIALDAKATALDRRGGFGLTASGRVAFPSGSAESWTGEGKVTGRGLLGVSTTLGSRARPEALVLAANAGFSTGGGAEGLADDLDLGWGFRVPWGVGASWAMVDPAWVSAEVFGAWIPQPGGQPAIAPAEGLLSLHLRPADSPLRIIAGAGKGFSDGVGTPTWRVLAGVSWVREPAERTPWLAADKGPAEPDPITAGQGRLSVRARQVRADGGDPDPVQATVVVLGTISDLDRRHHVIGRAPLISACKGDGRAVLELDPGEYTVRVVADGYEPDTRTITIRAGHDQPLVVDLEPAKQRRFAAGPQGEVGLLPSLGVVSFKPNGKALASEDRDAIAELAAWWARHLQGTFVVITGKATKDELAVDPSLHEARALAVKEAMSLPTGYTRCVTHRAGTCGNPRDEAECQRVTIEVTDLACPDLKPPPTPSTDGE